MLTNVNEVERQRCQTSTVTNFESDQDTKYFIVCNSQTMPSAFLHSSGGIVRSYHGEVRRVECRGCKGFTTSFRF